ILEQRADGRPLGDDLLLAGGELAERCGDTDGCHDHSLIASNSLSLAAMACGRASTGTSGSGVFSPWPVMHRATLSPAPILPSRTRARAAATVTPPAVSVKMPSVSASRRMPATISSSVAAAAYPPDARMAATA